MIDSVRIRGEDQLGREEVVVEIAVAGPGKLEVSIVRGDVVEDSAVVECADLYSALHVLGYTTAQAVENVAVPSVSPLDCAHANEKPVTCACGPGCYCKSHTCKPSAL